MGFELAAAVRRGRKRLAFDSYVGRPTEGTRWTGSVPDSLSRRSELRGCAIHLEAAIVHRVQGPYLVIARSTTAAAAEEAWIEVLERDSALSPRHFRWRHSRKDIIESSDTAKPTYVVQDYDLEIRGRRTRGSGRISLVSTSTH